MFKKSSVLALGIVALVLGAVAEAGSLPPQPAPAPCSATARCPRQQPPPQRMPPVPAPGPKTLR